MMRKSEDVSEKCVETKIKKNITCFRKTDYEKLRRLYFEVLGSDNKKKQDSPRQKIARK